ncbi:hypothetical protein [Actinophytocola algeriensis]|uniref:Uncharacterized protein n=1 Tax=Actinophytocola algeriensis TaxID=1768010 RepID=A0A7W7Q6P0_9PSEU|nr:hypothetical protein [Actinophytocola algeriensis]MBB4907714.1 hypothetical protein [Actinophytocola algeriensis]MBE1479744.1 hypothetical protein [Actinophytocola algeriensis]
MFTRSGMFAATGREMQLSAAAMLANLTFLDDRDDEHRAAVDALGRYGKLGVHGPFTAIFGAERRCVPEVASVYAELFHRFGYLSVDRMLTADEWVPFTTLRDWVGDRDVRRSEVEAVFGPPSLLADKRVLCYAPEDGSGWVFFDCWQERVERYEPGHGRFDVLVEDDPLVRDIRVPAGTFDDGLVLTLFGRVLRWGPGWWIHHPGHDQSPETGAIAAQLRQLQAGDPSQA